MSRYVLLAETGSDIPREIARKLDIYLVPMHVALDDVTLDDGAFPVERVVDAFNRTGRVPRTSGCTPEDFSRVYDRIHREHPGSVILHLAYSAVTTCSYQSALTATRGRDDVMVISLDTRQVSAGQAAIVLAVAKLLRERLYLLVTPGLSREAQQLAERTAQELGYRRTIWLSTGCVITAHGGPGAFGLAGFASPQG